MEDGVRTTIPLLVAAMDPRAPAEDLQKLIDPLTGGSIHQKEHTAAVLASSDDLSEAIAWRLYSGIGRVSQPNSPGHRDDCVCAWFYDWYQAGSDVMRRFVLRQFPAMLWSYVAGVLSGSPPAGIEACLLSMYNAESEERRVGKTAWPAFDPPPADAATVYRQTTSAASLTANALRQHDKQPARGANSLAGGMQLESIDCVCTGNRLSVMRVAVARYNTCSPLLPQQSRSLYCRVVERVLGAGYPFDAVRPREQFPGVGADKAAYLTQNPAAQAAATRRLHHTPEFIVECIAGLAKCAAVQELREDAIAACKVADAAATFLCLPEAILAARALLRVAKRFDDDDAANGRPRRADGTGKRASARLTSQQAQAIVASKGKKVPENATPVAVSGGAATAAHETSDEDDADDDQESSDDESGSDDHSD